MNRSYSATLLYFCVALLVGCDSGGSGASDTSPADTQQADTTTPDTLPPDGDTAPSTLNVLSTVPLEGAVVSPVAPIVITFDLALERVTLNDTTVTVMAGATPVTGTHTVEGAVYTFTPSEPLRNDTEHTVTLTTGIRASAGGPNLASHVILNFKTMAGMRVVSVEPLDGATNVATSSAVRVVFDRPVLSRSVNADTFKVVTSGWVDGTYYDGAPLPGGFRVLDEAGLTVDEGVMIQWYVATQTLPEYEVRHEVEVTRRVVGADGAVLDEPFTSTFSTQLLSGSHYYYLRVDGEGDDRRLGLDTSGNLPIFTDYTGGPGFDWYVVYLNDGKSVGLWNRAANEALRDNGASAATVESWQGILGQGFQLRRYGGTNGRDEAHVSPFDYILKSNAMAEGQALRAEITTSGLVALFARPDNGHTGSLWYFVRGPRK